MQGRSAARSCRVSRLCFSHWKRSSTCMQFFYTECSIAMACQKSYGEHAPASVLLTEVSEVGSRGVWLSDSPGELQAPRGLLPWSDSITWRMWSRLIPSSVSGASNRTSYRALTSYHHHATFGTAWLSIATKDNEGDGCEYQASLVLDRILTQHPASSTWDIEYQFWFIANASTVHHPRNGMVQIYGSTGSHISLPRG